MIDGLQGLESGADESSAEPAVEATVSFGGGGGKAKGKRPPYWWEEEKKLLPKPEEVVIVVPAIIYPPPFVPRQTFTTGPKKINKKRAVMLAALLDE